MKKFSCLLLLLVFLCACTKKDAKPRNVNPETDLCARCGMQVANPRLAAQAVPKEGDENLIFEEIGCAVAWLDRYNFWDRYALYVTDLKNGGWIKYDEALLVIEYTTPMGYGIAALSKKSDLEEGKALVTGRTAAMLVADLEKIRKCKTCGNTQ